MFATHRSPVRALVVPVAAAACLVLAAGSAAASDTTEPSTDSTVAGDWVVSIVDDPRVALSFTHPADWELSEVRIDAADDATYVEPCNETVRFSIGADDPYRWHGIEVELVPVDCQADNSRIGNGFHGLYRSIDEVVQPYGVEEIDTPIGDAVVFTQEYYECTNDCTDFTERLAIITLDEPADERYPAVVIRDNENQLDDHEFTALLDGARAEAGTPSTTEA